MRFAVSVKTPTGVGNYEEARWRHNHTTTECDTWHHDLLSPSTSRPRSCYLETKSRTWRTSPYDVQRFDGERRRLSSPGAALQHRFAASITQSESAPHPFEIQNMAVPISSHKISIPIGDGYRREAASGVLRAFSHFAFASASQEYEGYGRRSGGQGRLWQGTRGRRWCG